MAMALFAAHRIFQSADCVLYLACSLVGLAFSFQLLVAEDLPGGFFDGSHGPLCRTFDSIFIHCPYPRCLLGTKNQRRRRSIVPDSVVLGLCSARLLRSLPTDI